MMRTYRRHEQQLLPHLAAAAEPQTRTMSESQRHEEDLPTS